MARLKSRQRYIPNGFRFYQPETGWTAPRNASFEVIVNALIHHRQGQKHLAAKHRWALEHDAVADEVDRFNAKICEQMGWNDYIQASTGGAPAVPFFSQSQSNPSALAAVADKVKTIWAGVRTLNDWLDSNTPPVPANQSQARAAVCAACPKNTSGDFTQWFTRPAAEVIRRQLERLHARSITTPLDARLNVCDVCLCPLKLKVHTPLSYINAHLSEPVLKDLESVSPSCWIVAERRA